MAAAAAAEGVTEGTMNAAPLAGVTDGFSADRGRGPGLGLLACSAFIFFPGGASITPGDSKTLL